MSYRTIESNVKLLRDPFVLPENGVYYMYGTDWQCWKSTGDLAKWEKMPDPVKDPEDCEKHKWAPEVHKYNGAYYMFTTYFSKKRQRRGCTIFKSSSPEGPFEEITNGHITPGEWDCIDGTLYIDKENKPWMVFVHEWVCMSDKVGTFAAARLSDDFTHFVSEPIELFRADATEWAGRGVTDGCFMYRTEEGKLLMLWSNFAKSGGYCEAIAYSESGEIDGKWLHDEKLLFSMAESGKYDGGHGMIFDGYDGRKYLVLHSPNAPVGERSESPIFLEIKEENGTLSCVKE